ncbi:sigma-70 family RNA polymerase sigma factor [Singulisphaera sp. GP187]|uniref:sigma-70 family RNA polymerase sigma factor n=1 Tax=Singulisphaera sp. GP187 TaxID=1882752 RepID=UPI00094093A8|nr:sigma-70 family RNA polymerase sigma factor [Singulisphaera sp. GP187]
MPHLRTVLGFGAVGSACDAQLLERFHDHSGKPEAEVAFAVLVARHGPMVWGVCRRVLRDPDDVADAFQATFLVLVRKAGSVRVEDSLGRWLYGVSRRVAAKARAERARRSRREKRGPGGEPAVADWPHDAERRELLAAIDEEVERLPGPFRAAVELCDLGGLTHEAAAWQLGCPVGTIESRLARGRKRLRERLAQRGLAPLVVGLENLLPPGVPESLSHATVAVAMQNAIVSTSAVILVESAIKEMTMRKLMTMALGFGAIAACGLGVAFGPRVMAENERPKPVSRPHAAAEQSSRQTALKLQPPARVKPGDTLTIEVLQALPGRPITGDRVVRPDGTISLGFYGDLEVAGLNRYEIKTKLVNYLRNFLADDFLGLWRDELGDLENPDDVKRIPVEPKDSHRVFVDDTPIYTSPPVVPLAIAGGPPRVQPGDRLLIEVLKPIQGRPIAGERVVRPDGTISLGFYGDVQVAGLSRREIKERLVGHLRRFLPSEDLGLTRKDPRSGRLLNVAPADSDHVFVDEGINFEAAIRKHSSGTAGAKLDRILQSLDELKSPGSAGERPESEIAQRLGDHDRRLGEIESKLDRLIQAIEGLK